MSAADPRDAKGLQITIMGRNFRVSCKEEEQASLLEAVDYLNHRMEDIRDQGKIVGLERIAIMAALNIAHELLAGKPAKAAPSVDDGDYRRRIALMQETLDAALAADQDKLF